MTEYNDYLINVLLKNGEILALHYATRDLAMSDFKNKVTNNPAVMCASVHDENDDTIAEYAVAY